MNYPTLPIFLLCWVFGLACGLALAFPSLRAKYRETQRLRVFAREILNAKPGSARSLLTIVEANVPAGIRLDIVLEDLLRQARGRIGRGAP